jgi:hypothetical protein
MYVCMYVCMYVLCTYVYIYIYKYCIEITTPKYEYVVNHNQTFTANMSTRFLFG